MKNLLIKYKPIISYLVFGIFTTLINWGAYYLCYSIVTIPNIASTVIAWILAVSFAFITNKFWVFNSKALNKNVFIHELWTFIVARLTTGIIDVVIMYFAVDMFAMNSTIWKLISNIIVIIINYVLSKLIFLQNGNSDQSKN